MDHGQHQRLGVAGVFPPDVRVRIYENANESIKEFHSVHWQIHIAVVKFQGLRIDICAIIGLIHTELYEFSGVHIECLNTVLHLIHLNVEFAIFDALGVQIIADHSKPLSLDSRFHSEGTDPTEHVAEHLAVFQKCANDPISLGT